MDDTTDSNILDLAQTVASLADTTRLPELKGDALASLTTCSVNLNSSCDFQTSRKYEQYMHAWKHPAPMHCKLDKYGRKPKPEPPEDPTLKERLGLNTDPLCRALVAS